MSGCFGNNPYDKWLEDQVLDRFSYEGEEICNTCDEFMNDCKCGESEE